MKNFATLFFAAALALFTATETQAQKQYKIGYASQQTVSYDDTIYVAANSWTSIFKLTMDTTNVVVNLADGSTSTVPGAQVVFKITASSTAAEDTIFWGSGFVAPDFTVDTLKTSTASFIYDGSNYVLTGTAVTN